jgi:NADPH2:quinone reductase
MRRVRYHGYGGPEVLTVEEVAPPVPGDGQALLRAEAIGVNFVDTLFRRGGGSIFRRPLPGRPTGDVVGTVAAVGPGVDPALVGSRVAALAEDAYADLVVTDARWLAPVPGGLDAGAASTLPMAAPLALRLLRAAGLTAGATVLVHAAAGGIGHLAVQVARELGAGTVIGTAGSAAKLDLVRSLGADAAIDYTEGGWAARARDAAPAGVDIVLDSVGGEVLRDSLGLLAPFGRAVVYGAAGGDPGQVAVTDLYMLRSVTGFNISAWRRVEPDLARRDIEEATGLAATGAVRTTVHARLPLAEAATAHRIMEERRHHGRVLLLT